MNAFACIAPENENFLDNIPNNCRCIDVNRSSIRRADLFWSIPIDTYEKKGA